MSSSSAGIGLTSTGVWRFSPAASLSFCAAARTAWVSSPGSVSMSSRARTRTPASSALSRTGTETSSALEM
ncbi:hypothetical protein [Brevibacterium sandarakinum]|uniref:hypothetical protein n=1 Tax=Brevibacterium sandarakinum TaxID=629680 RepID=UPI001E52B228|nr:hypothetical protein [Brevibacterium sandarakinum]